MARLALLNRLLPFATPGTPLIQDLLHLAAICILLYFAPQIEDWLHRREANAGDNNAETAAIVPNDNDRDAEAGANDAEPDAMPEEGEVDGLDDEDLDDDRPPPANVIPGEGQAGAAAHAGDIPPERNVGAKKAKSLARRDQRRAYNEFMRSQGEAQRARDAEGATEREAALAVEKERRRAAEVALEAKKAKEREQRRQREETERKEEICRRELAVSLVKEELEARNMCDLSKTAQLVGDDVDEEWVERILRATGVIGKKGDTMTMVTSTGWVVRVTAEDMAKLYTTAAENGIGGDDGRIEYDELGAVLETMIRT